MYEQCSNDCQQFVQPLSPAVSRGNGSCNTNSPSASLVAHVCVLCILAAATIRGWCLFHLELPTVQLPFKGGDYSKKYGMKDMYTISKLSISPTYSGFSDLCNSRVKSLKP